MNDQEMLDGFMEGFAKVAEEAGYHGEAVRTLMELSVDLAQHSAHPEEFSAGFNSVLGA